MLFKDENTSLFPAQTPAPQRITDTMTPRRSTPSIQSLLADPRIRRIDTAGRTWYVAADVAQVLADTEHPAEYWHDLKTCEPHLAALAETASAVLECGFTKAIILCAAIGIAEHGVGAPERHGLKARHQLAESLAPFAERAAGVGSLQ